MASSDPIFTELPALAELFDRPSLDDWRRTAEASLKGRALEELTVTTHEGLEIAPLATAEDTTIDPGYPGQLPFVRGRGPLGPGPTGWQVRQRIAHPDPAIASRWAAEELERGASSLWLVLDTATGKPDDEPEAGHGNGMRIFGERDLDPLLESVDLSMTPIHLTVGGSFAAAAAILVAATRRHGIASRELLGGFDCDPVGALAGDGTLPTGLAGSLELLAELAFWVDHHAPELTTITVDTTAYHQAGATAVQELAYALSTALEYLRALTDRGFAPGAAGRHIGFRHAIGRDLFIEAAKLRAARRLWARVAEACGMPENRRAAPIHAVASPRGLTTRDPWVNMLRTTVGSFAAAVGGADALTVLPFDSAIGLSDELARRTATNSQTILREESHLDRVVDPGGGSWYLEKLTDELATAAWRHFQTIEAAGGMTAFLLDASVARELDQALAEREQAIATGREPITGVSSYPNLTEKELERDSAAVSTPSPASDEDPTAALARLFKTANAPAGDGAVIEAAIEAASQGATVVQLDTAFRANRQATRFEALPKRREAERFERLRDASDAWLADRGIRPRIFLANLGPVADHKPRAAFATGFFEAGGIEALGNDGFATAAEAAEAFADADTQMAVICSSDVRYPEVVPELARALDERGARTVLVAGRPGEHESEWRDAGITGFIHLGCDHYRMLVDLLKEEGVLHV